MAFVFLEAGVDGRVIGEAFMSTPVEGLAENAGAHRGVNECTKP